MRTLKPRESNLELLPDDQRVMPETVPDEAILTHRTLCKCPVCTRPGMEMAFRRKRRSQGLRG